MNAKKLLILYVLEVLKKYSDQNHKLTQCDIISYIQKDYEMDCERKAVARNISYLQEFGYDISTKADNGEGIWLVSREFEDAELRLLIDSVYSSKFLSEHYSKSIIDKLNRKSSIYFKSRTRHILPVIENNRNHNTTIFYNIDIIDEAIERHKKISFIYNYFEIDKKLHPKHEKEHIVNPYQILIHNSKYYLIGNIDKYDNIVNFRMDLITNMKIIEDTAIKPVYNLEDHKTGLDLRKVKNEFPYMYSGKTESIVIRTEKGMIGDFIDWFGEDIKIKECDNEKIEIRFTANINAMRYWILQYSLHLEIIYPSSLREMHTNDIKCIYEKYFIS
ncbi:MAG: WYL domain-containing protein [Clostridia bacterium]|nr:WYL domain-containing protein [Clostridia bacterium]